MAAAPRVLTDAIPAIQASLQAVVPPDDGGVWRLIRYHMGWVEPDGTAASASSGKLLRPALVLASVQALGGSRDSALVPAAAVELLHNFTLIHDDIEDDSPTRRGRATAWSIWGVPLAINAGDALHVLARHALTSSPALDDARTLALHGVFDRVSLALCAGQHADMVFESAATVTPDDYLAMIGGKTAALVGACLEIGAVVAGAPASVRSAARQAGDALGMAFQIHDDILGIWGDEAALGKSVSSDITTRKKTLPVLAALEHHGPGSRLATIYDPATPAAKVDAAEVLALLDAAGARDASAAAAGRYLAEGRALLDQAYGAQVAPLRELAAYVLDRES